MKSERNRCRRMAGLYMHVLFFLCLFALSASGLVAADALKPIKANGLITPAEATAIIGGPVSPPEEKFREFRSQKSWMSTCTWFSESKGISVAVTLTPIRSDLTCEKAYAQYVAGMEKSLGMKYTLAPIAGVGEKAGWDSDMKQLIVFKKPVQMVLTVSGSRIGKEAALDMGKKIAVKMMSRVTEK